MPEKDDKKVEEDFVPTVTEVKKDFADRGTKEGRPLDEQPKGHNRSEDQPKQLDGTQDDPDLPRYVNLAALISDEFGTARSEARLDIALGTVSVDGKEIQDKMDLPYDDIVGKTIVVESRSKNYTIDYRG